MGDRGRRRENERENERERERTRERGREGEEFRGMVIGLFTIYRLPF